MTAGRETIRAFAKAGGRGKGCEGFEEIIEA
jgi:hypothetical protein